MGVGCEKKRYTPKDDFPPRTFKEHSKNTKNFPKIKKACKADITETKKIPKIKKTPKDSLRISKGL